MRKDSLEWIARRYGERYGDRIGEGREYVPWFDVRDVPSRGVCSRFTGRLTGRMHVALSGLERSAILVAQWLDDVVDIREQFPLWPLDETRQIAESLGVAHPAHSGSLVLMTTDVVITKAAHGSPLEPLTVKPEVELKDRRVLEKFEIERLYWARRGRELGIVTEKELPEAFVANLEWIDECHEIAAETLSPGDIQRIEADLFGQLHASPETALNQLCARTDERIGERFGTCLGVVRHALSRKRWKIPLVARIDPWRPLPPPARTAVQAVSEAAQ